MQRDLAYLGCLHQRNLGDDAVLTATRGLLPGRRVHGYDMNLKPVGRPRAKDRPGVLLLGGGTLVGRWLWLEALEEAIQHLRPSSVGTIGVGVEDPDFPADDLSATPEVMRAWARTLSRFELVAVRGPRSAELLNDFGIESSVVGDPALSLYAGVVEPRPGLIALNVSDHRGIREATWESEDRVGTLGLVLDELLKRGFEVQLFAMAPADLVPLRALRHGRSLKPILRGWRSLEQTLQLLASAEVVVSQRLHGAVFAAAVGTPFVQTAYRPKSYDFARSIDAQAQVIGLGQVTANGLLDAVLETALNRRDLASSLRIRVTALVNRQRDMAQNLAALTDSS